MLNYINPETYYYKVFLFFQAIGVLDISNGGVVFVGEQYIFYFKLLLVFISVFCTFLVIDFLYRLMIIRKEELAWEKEQILKSIPVKEDENKRWQKIEQLLVSDNESDSRLAIIEADKMLDELLISLRYKGDSLGERLQSVEKGDMESLDDAWEAHKYRNRIAHEADMQVSEHEAKRIIGLYKKVLQEYKMI